MKPIVYLRWDDSSQGHQIDRDNAAKIIRNMRAKRHNKRPSERATVTYDAAKHATCAAIPWANVAAHICRL